MSSLDSFLTLRQRLNASVLGQEMLVDRLLIALLSDGHLLVEGLPGLAKTRSIRTLAGLIAADFHRLQFTPDLLPADLTGTEIYRPQDGSFHFEKGPVFHSVLLADEINRAPAKVQSALLEAMGERQVTVGQQSYPLPPLFMVMATQNPIEHEGVYPLPEAQLDRFMFHTRVTQPDVETETRIVNLALSEALSQLPSSRLAEQSSIASSPCLGVEEILVARQAVLGVYVAEPVIDYLVRLAAATRAPELLMPEAGGVMVEYGAGPRASLALARGIRARAWLAGRDYATPADVQALAPDVFRHRVSLAYAQRVKGMTVDQLIASLVERVPVP